MSTENIDPIVESTVTDDLDAFASDFFGQKKEVAEPASSEAEDSADEDNDAHEDNTQDNEADTLEDEDDTTEADETPDEDAPKPKKSRFQERIDELTAKAREAERREQALQKRLEDLEQQRTPPVKTEDHKTTDTESVGPAPDDENEDGTEKYPLGEFDPLYIRDLTKFTIQQERELQRAEDQKDQQAKQFEAEKTALEQGWKEKVETAQERYPDFHEKGSQLESIFTGIDPTYGEYLGATLMSMDFGPDVLYYLADHPDEAKQIVASGPTKATISLGRLEAKFAIADAEKTIARPKVSKAPTPPQTLKGSAVVSNVADDTDDLDAFAQKLFKKK